jgi:hypothetical protein
MASISRPVARSVILQRRNDGAERGLRGHAGHGIHRRVDRIDASFDRGQHRSARDAGGIVRVQMQRQIGSVFEGLDQRCGSRRLQQAGHILDADDVCAGRLKLLGQIHIVGERIFGPVRIVDVAGVAQVPSHSLPASRTASMETRMFSTQLRQSNTRKRSMPPLCRLERRTGAPHCRDSWCSPRRWSHAAASE